VTLKLGSNGRQPWKIEFTLPSRRGSPPPAFTPEPVCEPEGCQQGRKSPGGKLTVGVHHFQANAVRCSLRPCLECELLWQELSAEATAYVRIHREHRRLVAQRGSSDLASQVIVAAHRRKRARQALREHETRPSVVRAIAGIA
jgi:hypothetical protein